MQQSHTFRAMIDLTRRVIAGFDQRNRYPWSVEITMVELMKPVGDLAKHVMVAEHHYLVDRDHDPRYATSDEDIADELADIRYCVIRLADHYGIDLESAHLRAREKELAYQRRVDGGV